MVVPLVCGVAVWAVWFSGLFAVRRVEVVGSSGPTEDRIATAAHAVLGRPLARVDTAGLRRRVAAIPGVASVRVRRSLPSTLRLTVTERQALAVVERSGALWLVDRHGVLFQRVRHAPGRLPRLVVPDAGPKDPAARAALAAVQALPESLRAKVGQVSAPTPQSVRLRLRDGRTVRWGGADHGGLKARVLAALLHRPGTVYDVSASSVVTVR